MAGQQSLIPHRVKHYTIHPSVFRACMFLTPLPCFSLHKSRHLVFIDGQVWVFIPYRCVYLICSEYSHKSIQTELQISESVCWIVCHTFVNKHKDNTKDYQVAKQDEQILKWSTLATLLPDCFVSISHLYFTDHHKNLGFPMPLWP